MKFSVLAGATLSAATFVSAQAPIDVTSAAVSADVDGDEGGLLVGGTCGSLGPKFYQACCEAHPDDPTCGSSDDDDGEGESGGRGGHGSDDDGPDDGGPDDGESDGDEPSVASETPLSGAFPTGDPPQGAFPTGRPQQGNAGASVDAVGGGGGGHGHGGHGGDPTTDLPYGYTTSIQYVTVVSTKSDCPPEVTDCPARTYPVITSVISAYTTICPIATLSIPSAYAVASSAGGNLVTATIYTTQTNTITECAAEVTDCPARETIVTVPAYTTVCPESEVPIYPTYPITRVVPAPDTEAAAPTVPAAISTTEGANVPAPTTTDEEVEAAAPAVAGFLSAPPVNAATPAGRILANGTGSAAGVASSYAAFTGAAFMGAAGDNRVGAVGFAAGLAAPFLALFL